MKIKQRVLNYSYKKNNVYIIPSRMGFRFLVINFALFIISMVYTNNLALLITFFMVTYFILQMFNSHKIINDLKLHKVDLSNDFSNANHTLITKFTEYQNEETLDLIHCNLVWNQGQQLKAKNEACLSQKALKLKLLPLTRGRYDLDYIKFYTLGVSRLFYVWRYFPLKQNLYIYPEKEKAHSINSSHTFDKGERSLSEQEFQEYIRYTPSLPSKRIDWKIFAKSAQLYAKKYEIYKAQDLEINYSLIDGDTEQRLKKMSYLINEAYLKDLTYKVVLINSTLKSNNGYDHYKESMERISEF